MQHVTQETYGGQAPARPARRLLSCFLALLLAFALVPAQALAPQAAYAADAEWSLYGGCEWSFDNLGAMVIRPAAQPQAGYVSGQLPNETSTTEKYPFPWTGEQYYRSFSTITVESGVKAGTSCRRMFADLQRVTRIDLSGLDLSAATDMRGMFQFDESTVDAEFEGDARKSQLQTVIFSNPSTSSVTRMGNMFDGCKNLETIQGMDFDTSKVTSLASMFKDCERLGVLDLTGFNTVNVGNMTSMFENCRSLYDLRLGGSFSTAKVSNMLYMFKNCGQLLELPVQGFDTSRVTMMNEMFAGCSKIEELDLSGWDISLVNDFTGMFAGCIALRSLSYFKSNESATTMKDMFSGCIKIERLYLDGFNTRSVTDFSSMFNGCGNLEAIFVSDSFVVGADARADGMFELCSALAGPFGTGYGEDKYGYAHSADYARIDAPGVPGLFTRSGQLSFYEPLSLGAPYSENEPSFWIEPLGTQYYFGSPVKPPVTILRGAHILQEGVDYRVSYSNNTNAGTGTATVTALAGSRFCQGSAVLEFPIEGLQSVDDIAIEFEQSSYAYTGEAIEPPFTVFAGASRLYEGTGPGEYEVVGWRDNVKPGDAAVILRVHVASGDPIEVEGSFRIEKISLGGAVAALTGSTSLVYTGSPLRPGVSVWLDDYLREGIDYRVEYSANTAPGTAAATVVGMGAYEGSLSIPFTIIGPLAKASFRLSANAFTYDGKAKAPGVTVTMGGKVLRQGADYTLSYQGNVNAGTAYAVVTGRGIYSGTVRVGFRINPVSVASSAVKFAPLVSKAYNRGKAISQVPAATYAGLTLKNKTDFTVTYKNNKKLGTAKVTVKGKGNYTGTKTLSFKIVKYKQPMTAKASSKTAKYSTVKKKASTIKKCITVKKAQGKVTYANASTTSALKKFKVNAKNGAITVPKGTKKGTYKVKVKVETKGTSKYAYGSKTVTVSIKVK